MTKRITLALAMIGLSATAFAGSPGDNMVAPTGVNVVAPDSVGTWSFGLEALYMQPGTEFQYATVQTVDADDNFNQHNKSTKNNWDWGVEADISYMFPGSSRDVSLAYTYINFNNSNSTTEAASISAFPDVFGNVFDSAKGRLDQTLNQVDLTFGQLIRVGDRVDLHPFAGVRFASIDTDNKGTYNGFNDDDDAVIDTLKVDSDFMGAGPRAGIDGSVHLGSGFSIVGTFAASAIVGDMQGKFKAYTNETGTPVTEEYKNDSYTAVVPEVDAKLGLDYNFTFNANSSMDVQLGYQVVNYFNAQDNDIVDSVFVNSVNNTDNFNYQGPYLRLQLNVA